MAALQALAEQTRLVQQHLLFAAQHIAHKAVLDLQAVGEVVQRKHGVPQVFALLFFQLGDVLGKSILVDITHYQDIYTRTVVPGELTHQGGNFHVAQGF
jgi:hypothetical protein